MKSSFDQNDLESVLVAKLKRVEEELAKEWIGEDG
jgi:hypothetical protein